MNRDSDLAQAFRHARRRGLGLAPINAGAALQTARRLIAALPALEEAAKAARAAVEAQRPIDCRKYAPAWVKVTEEAAKARKALEAGRAFKYAGAVWRRGYCGTWQPGKPGLFYVEDAESLFRNVEKAAEVGGRYNRAGIPSGYYSDPYQEGLVVAYIVQLRGRNGRAFFAPAYQFEETDNGGMTVDLSRIEESNPAHDQENTTARKDAAMAADSMAEKAAEEEREYQTAWQAGSQWAALKEEEEESRREALAILKERRAARALDPATFPALCRALRGEVAGLVRAIVKSRAKRAALAQGDGPELYFYTGEERLRGAFCDGASLKGFPV